MEHTLVFTVMIIYLVLTIVFASVVSRKVRDSDSFLIASRGLPWFLVAAVITGDWIGGGSVIGVAQKGYTSGITGCIYNIGMFLALVLFTFTLAKRYRRTGFITVPEMVKSFFGSKTAHLASVIIMLAYAVIQVTTLVSGGTILSLVLGTSQSWGIGISAILFLAITLAGGLVSISVTNILHVTVLFFGLLMSAIFGLAKVGGWSGLTTKLPPSYFEISGGLPLQLWSGDIVSVAFGFLAAQVLISGVLAGKNPESTAKGCLVSAFMVLPIGVVCALLGMISKVIYGDSLPHGLGAGPAAMMALNPWVGAFAMCGLWAAIVSSGPAILLALSQLVVRDIYVGIIRPNAPDHKVLFYSRGVAVLMSLFTFAAALSFYEVLRGILWAFAIRTGIGILIVMIAYLGMKRINEHGAFWALIAGLITQIYWFAAKQPFSIHEVYPTLGVVMCVALLISAFTKRKQQIPEDVKRNFGIKE